MAHLSFSSLSEVFKWPGRPAIEEIKGVLIVSQISLPGSFPRGRREDTSRLRIQTAAKGVNGFVKALRWKTEIEKKLYDVGDPAKFETEKRLFGNCRESLHIEELGEPFDDWYDGGPMDFLSDKLLLFMRENQGVCNWAIRLDCGSDPPVVVEVDTAPVAKWLPCTDRFSTFVWRQIWDHSQLAVGVSAQEIHLLKRDLSFLKSNFDELPTTYGWPGNVNYRFKFEKGAIIICGGRDRGVDWFVSTRSTSDLKAVLGKVWHCGNLAESMYGEGEADAVLRELRDSAARDWTA